MVVGRGSRTSDKSSQRLVFVRTDQWAMSTCAPSRWSQDMAIFETGHRNERVDRGSGPTSGTKSKLGPNRGSVHVSSLPTIYSSRVRDVAKTFGSFGRVRGQDIGNKMVKTWVTVLSSPRDGRGLRKNIITT